MEVLVKQLIILALNYSFGEYQQLQIQINMDNTQITNSSILTLKREMFRSKLRRDMLEKRFKYKRAMKIKAVCDQIEKLQEANNMKNDSCSEHNQISEESADYFAVFQIGRGSKRQILTYKILKSMKFYIQKNNTYQNQMYKVFNFCTEQLLNPQQENAEYLPLLAEIIFLLQNYSNIIEPQPFVVLLRAFVRHQEYKSLILQYPNLIEQLEEFCQERVDNNNLIKLLCEKITYANLKMISFLFNTLKNKDVLQLFELYGLKQVLIKNVNNENYGKLINKILFTTGWIDEQNESENQSYQIFADVYNVF
ncbi:unnamed protein product (macronuclear) [Paramecium tetraurelia]|uniref:Uncharacterized protein n=1 Tax=Paramecium tetraurelia TaxID=5888 RepID=A0BAW9_PARTE|nr:uncharacterized protein GSPATT00000121001 [Paramecium tetraurelia]CAK55686.1 unnamed protein product [Paramecium tetraurelia]|eukprot:XP_001423084.1 hypothetical protein (macronuclear) [Paramecium tetraurelia strain d4-2]